VGFVVCVDVPTPHIAGFKRDYLVRATHILHGSSLLGGLVLCLDDQRIFKYFQALLFIDFLDGKISWAEHLNKNVFMVRVFFCEFVPNRHHHHYVRACFDKVLLPNK